MCSYLNYNSKFLKIEPLMHFGTFHAYRNFELKRITYDDKSFTLSFPLGTKIEAINKLIIRQTDEFPETHTISLKILDKDFGRLCGTINSNIFPDTLHECDGLCYQDGCLFIDCVEDIHVRVGDIIKPYYKLLIYEIRAVHSWSLLKNQNYQCERGNVSIVPSSPVFESST